MEVYSVAESAPFNTKKAAVDDLDFEGMQRGRYERIQIAGVQRLATRASLLLAAPTMTQHGPLLEELMRTVCS